MAKILTFGIYHSARTAWLPIMDMWCNRQITVTVIGPDGRQEIKLPQPFARIGSHSASEIVLPDADKRSLYLHATDAGIFCVDLRDHGKASSPVLGKWIEPDSTLTFGAYSLQVALEPQTGADCLPAASLMERGSSPRPIPVFRVTCKAGPKARYRLHRVLTLVGRYSTCGLNLSGSAVSSPHCVLYYDQGRIWCIDLLSGNGTYHNGQRRNVVEVAQSDRLRVGEFKLVFSGYSQRQGQSCRPTSPTADLAERPSKASPFGESLPSENGVPGTVRLGTGDTVAFPEDESALPDEAVSAEGAIASGLRDQSAAQQEGQLAALHEQIQSLRDRWDVEREQFSNQVAEQATIIDGLRAELAEARSLLDQCSDETPGRGDIGSLSAGLPKATLKIEDGSLRVSRVGLENQPATHNEILDIGPAQARQRVVLRDPGREEDPSGLTAEHDTVEIVQFIHPTVVWHERAAANSPLQNRGLTTPEFVQDRNSASADAYRSATPLPNDQLLIESSLPAAAILETPQKTELRDELSAFVNNRILDIERIGRSQSLVRWAGLVLGFIVFAGAIASICWLGFRAS